MSASFPVKGIKAEYRHVVKYVPAWFPGAEFQRKAQVVKRDAMDLLNKPYELLQRRAVRVTSVSSV